MACSFFNNNGYQCGGCVNFIKSTSITLSGTTLTITIPQMTFNNRDKICLCLAQPIPTGVTQDTTVTIVSGGTKFSFQTKFGNLIYGDAIRCRRVYPVSVATDTSLFVLQDMCKLCRTRHVFPTITTTAAAAASVASLSVNGEREF